MENAICFEKHDGVDITNLKDESCDGKESQGKNEKSTGQFCMAKVLQN
jgi:hypothetical protein